MKKLQILISTLFLIVSLTASAQLSVLLVNDNGYAPERVDIIKTAITNSGFTYGFWDAPVQGAGPDLATMQGYDLVVWYTGNDGVGLYLWNGDETVNQDITTYIDGGGMFWIQGLDFLYDKYATTPVTFVEGDFVFDYLGISEYFGQSHVDDGVVYDGVPQLDIVQGNGIFTLDPVLWTYSTMWYVDALVSTGDAQDVYQMGPQDYDLAEYFSAIYLEKGAGKILTFAFETARLDSQGNTDFLIGEGLEYFEQFAGGTTIYVEEINVSSESGEVVIDENLGTLQMQAEVLPEDATNPNVSWSITDGTASASINQDGLLQSTGAGNGNGTVWAKATALDGSGVMDSVMITISEQGSDFNVLLVNDNGYDPDRIDIIKTAIENSGYVYGYWDAPVEGAAPSLPYLSAFDLVIWYTGNDGGSLYFWNGDETVNTDIQSYIDAGGMFWVQGLDFLYDKYPETPVTFVEGDFVYDYLGISEYFGQSHLDDGVWSDGVPQLDVVSENEIFTLDPMLWFFETMWYVDALLKTNDAEYIYQMGPEGYDLSDYYSAIYLEKGDGKVLSFTFETARLDSQDNTDFLIGEGLTYFEQFAGGSTIYVEEINVTSGSGVYVIDENLGTLQMLTEVLPENASNPVVYWSVIDETGTATIDQNGLLQSTGTSSGNGTVLVKASAIDGSGVEGTVSVTISNQGSDFEILLVNDNANGTDRYKVLDTILNNLNYTHTIYNTVATGDFPDLSTLESFDVVMWYTGNDGDGLKLWDVSDTNDYKFNQPLIQYLDNGGKVWLQGLDFFYDIYGSAPDFFVDGQFIYDYMGVASYAAQSYADDGNMGVAQLDVVPGNPVCSFTPIQWAYSTMWFVDALEISPYADGVYTLGPEGYIFDEYFAGVFNHYIDSKILTFTFETARLDSYSSAEDLFYQVLEFFKTYVSTEENIINEQSTLVQVYPNPVSDIAIFSNTLGQAANVSISIMDIAGRQVFFKDYGIQQAGENKIEISVKNSRLQTGIYTFVLRIDNMPMTGKLIIN